MPWNQPLKTKQQIKRSPKISRFKYFGFIIGSILIVVLSLLLFERDEPTQIENRKVAKKSYAKAKADLIAKVEAKTKKRFNTVKQSVKPSGPVDLGYGFYTNRVGEVKARTRPAFVIRPRQSKELFTQPAENFISAIVNTPLGQPLYDQDVPENFEELFKQSLTNTIVITEDDTPDEVLAKQRTIDAKEFIRDLMRKGENVREILLQEKQIIKKKHESYMTIEQGLMELRSADASPDEIAEYALAAKMMMEQLELENPLHLDLDETDAMEKLDKLINPRAKQGEVIDE